MKFHNIGMVGPFVNQKLGSLPTFDTERDQGRMAWLLDGTLWYGSDTGWLQLQKELSDSEIASGLEKITEGANSGWRLKGRDAQFYGNIGQDAVDISTPISELNDRGGAKGSNSYAEGIGTISQNDNQHTAGKYNLGSHGNTIHETGIGTDDNNRKNAFEIYTTGLVTAPALTDSLINSDPDSLVTRDYIDTHTGGSGLEKITEGSQSGWRLIGENAVDHGSIGVNAVDMSVCNITSTVQGATGNYSHSEGYNTIALGVATHAEGQYNIGTDPQTIHETGIGTSNSNRINAFVVYRDGTLTAPESTTALINSRGDTALITKSYSDDTYLTETYADTRYLTQNNASNQYTPINTCYTESESDDRYTPINTCYTESESDDKYTPINTCYTKSASDDKYTPINTCYTKSTSDGRYTPINTCYTKSASDGRYVEVGGDKMTGSLTFTEGRGIYSESITTTSGFRIIGSSWGSGGPSNNSNILFAGWNSTNDWHVRMGDISIERAYINALESIRFNVYTTDYPSWESAHQGVRLIHYSPYKSIMFLPKYDFTGSDKTDEGGCYCGSPAYRWKYVYSWHIHADDIYGDLHQTLLKNISTPLLDIDIDDVFYSLNPKIDINGSYTFDVDSSNIFSEYSDDDDDNTTDCLNIGELLPLMTKVIQNQKQLIQDLTSRIEVLE